MRVLIPLLLVIWATTLNAAINDPKWLQFKRKYGKTYTDAAVEASRFKVFMENVKKIEAHNNKYRQRTTTFSLGINQFSDMTYEEFASKILMRRNGALSKPLRNLFQKPHSFTAPESVDWRKQGYVTPVKDQGSCGSCYSFSAIGGLEGQHFKKTGNLVSLSEQNILDCSGQYGNNGCDGGFLQASYDYISDNDGVDTEKYYPYEGREMRCSYDPDGKGATCKGYHSIRREDEDALKDAVASVGPIPACIYAADSFQQYSGGIYYGYDCPTDDTNHCILIVGYGSANGHDYWLVKNSWGTSWGDEGYIKMSRNRNNNCQIASDAHYPIV